MVGAEDGYGLTKPKAYVVLRDPATGGAALTDELKAFVKTHLAPFKYPRWVEIVASCPRPRPARSSASSCAAPAAPPRLDAGDSERTSDDHAATLRCCIARLGSMARALKFHAIVSGKTLSLPDLGAFEGKRVEVIVVEEEAPAEIGAPPRGAATARAVARQFVVPDDFDVPLPPEIPAVLRWRR